MHSEPKLSFQHGQRLASAYGLKLPRIALKYYSRVDVPREVRQPEHGLIVEKRSFVNVDVGSPEGFPELGCKTRLIQEPRNGIRLTKRLRHVWPGRLLSFGSQRNPALFTVGCNQHNGPAGVERRPDEPLHEVGFPDARAAADIQELILACHYILVDCFVLIEP